MAGGAAIGERTLKETPTWAVAVVCTVFIIISILIEHGIHTLEKWFHKKHKKAMSEALEKIKAELMLLGFLSLLLTVGTNYIAKICIPLTFGDIMLPCKKEKVGKESKDNRRGLLSFDDNVVWRRGLAAASGGDDYCSKKILLLVGTKLQLIIMEMAQEIQDRTTIVRGMPVVQPDNKFFWFNRPQWILFLIHFTLFQNAFQLAYFLWTWYEFKITSCFHENLLVILIRVVFGAFLQFLCSHKTFPLYALVTQMGSHMKKGIFEEQTAKALKKWQKSARENRKLRNAGSNEMPSMGGEITPSQGTSPMHLLHKFKPRSNQTETDSALYSPRSYQSDDQTDFSDTEGSTHQTNLNLNQTMAPPLHQPVNNNQLNHNIDFSFVKP